MSTALRRAPRAYSAPPPDPGALVMQHRAMLDRITRRVAMRCGGAITPGELFGAAALGLIQASQRFDPQANASFETFAEHRVRGAVLDELRSLDLLPRRLRADTEEVKKAARKLEATLGREPTPEEVAAETKRDVEEVVSLLQLAKPPEPLTPVVEQLLTHQGPDAEAQVMSKQASAALAREISRLSARNQQLLQMYYVDGLTYREIAQVLEVSEVRICQLHKDAIAALRASLQKEDES